MTATLRTCLALVGVTVGGFAIAACELEATDASNAEQSQPVQPSAQAAMDSIAEESSAVGDQNRIQSCVEQTMGRAFVGDEYWRGVWSDLGQDEARLRGRCEELALVDPVSLDQLHVEWIAFSAATATTVPAPETVPSTPPPSVEAPAPPPQPVFAEPAVECHPSYEPCVPLGSDADCCFRGQATGRSTLTIQ